VNSGKGGNPVFLLSSWTLKKGEVVKLKKGSILTGILFLCLLTFPPSLRASSPLEIDQEALKAYRAADYGAAVARWEEKITRLKEKIPLDDDRLLLEVGMDYLSLAFTCGWRLNQPERALALYRDWGELKASIRRAGRGGQSADLPIEFIYMTEICERVGRREEGVRYGEELLEKLLPFAKKVEGDPVNHVLAYLFTRLLKYQVDGLNLKQGEAGQKKVLLDTLDLDELTGVVASRAITFFMLTFFPAGEILLLGEDGPWKDDLARYIGQSPPDLTSMVHNTILLLDGAGESATEKSEKALDAYLRNYPDGFFSLPVRYHFIKRFAESGQPGKAGRLKRELEEIGSRRGLKLIMKEEAGPLPPAKGLNQ
jgi:hypothetical protein